ncbi:MAG: hypothetical protein ACO38W_00495 [Phycisphaerales bacterium]
MRRLRLLLPLAVLPALAGCPPKQTPAPLGAGAIDWPFRPAAPTDIAFEFDLFDQDTNRRLFDPVTQTYRLRLDRPWTSPPTPGSNVSIGAVLEVSPQERISGEVRVPW